MRSKAPEIRGTLGKSAWSVRNPNPRDRGKKEGAVSETVRARGAQHECQSRSVTG